MEKYNFHSVLSHLKMFHGLHMDTEDMEEIGLHAWDKIGNKRVSLYKYSAATEDCRLKLPCNVDIIEAVTSDTVDSQQKDNINRYDFNNYRIEDRIEVEKINKSPLYISGRLLTYHQDGEELVFRDDYDNINVLYKGVRLDDNGLPELTYKEVEAIANYCMYVDMRKKGMASKDQASIQLSQMLKVEWERSCSHARTPEYLNQNDWNDFLEAKNSWDRKRYNVSFKSTSR